MGHADHQPRIKKEKNLSSQLSDINILLHLHLLFFLTKENNIEQHRHHGQRRPYLLHIYSLRSHHCILDMHYYGGIGLHKLRFRHPQRPLLLQGTFQPIRITIWIIANDYRPTFKTLPPRQMSNPKHLPSPMKPASTSRIKTWIPSWTRPRRS